MDRGAYASRGARPTDLCQSAVRITLVTRGTEWAPVFSTRPHDDRGQVRCRTWSSPSMQNNRLLTTSLRALFACASLRWLAATVLLSSAAGCGTKPAEILLPPSKTTLVSTVIVGANANPDIRKRPSPAVVRVYELKSTALFESTDFVSLFDKDQASLGSELISREEAILSPNDVKAINKTLSPDAKFISVMVAFRELERARWRVFVPIVQGKKNVVKIRIDDVSVKIDREEP